MTKKIAIIQASPTRTASTLVINALLGFILPEEKVYYVDKNGRFSRIREAKKRMGDLVIIKTHKWNESHQNRWKKHLSGYEVFFISTERKELDKCINIKNDETLVIQFEDLLETDSRSLEDVVGDLHQRFSEFLPDHLDLSKETCLERLNEMNAMVVKMQSDDFKCFNSFYGIHGGHRNRGGR